ncbi:MAG: alpha/beta fold hydrolase, partial [Actinobacteria bacterium]|nr:alpha/beta fold hydrolase [Actinomycetota bacterium]
SLYWKMQVPYFARYARVIAFDPRGNGRSDRPEGAQAYADQQFADDAVAVLDAAGVDRAFVVCLSTGARHTLLMATQHQERVEGIAFIAPFTPLGDPPAGRAYDFDEIADNDEGWAKFNAHYWRRDYDGFLKFFFDLNWPEPHSTKAFEDAWAWAHETTPEILIDTAHGRALGFQDGVAQDLCARIRCPALVIQGSDDAVTGPDKGIALAETLGAPIVMIDGAGHSPITRDPVKVNLLLRDFFGLKPTPQRWTRGLSRRKRALFVSSPIGLGHAQRDMAIADELRRLHPDLQIEWLAQYPVTRALENRGEQIHPASRLLSREVDHIDSESGEHSLHVFQTWRNMDEILLANFMAFHDLVEKEQFDLWIGDEAWELDHYLHENPEVKRAPFIWLTDFVGWLPMPEGGEYEAFLAADHNAEMIEHIDRYPHVRDRSIFVGNPGDIVPDSFGADLPRIREWTEGHYDFAGYVNGFDAATLADRETLRERLGYGPGEKVCIVTVGGSGVGVHLLQRAIAAFPVAKRLVPELKMVVVAGPRIEPTLLAEHEDIEVRTFVPELHRHLAACDVAVVQGGLSTCMELTALRRPFLYFPLRHHFEQNFHVRHRLQRYDAGRCMDFESTTPGQLAAAIAEEMDRKVTSRPVETDGAARAAAMISELL